MLTLIIFTILFLFIMFIITIINSWMRVNNLRKTPRFGGDRWVMVNRQELHFVEFGDGPVLVLLPDFLHSYRSWNLVLPGLSKHFRCIALEYPGVGSSERQSDFSFKMSHQIQIISNFIEQLPVEMVHLLGIGYGGTLALQLAENFPLRIGRSVIIEAQSEPASEGDSPADKVLNYLCYPLIGHLIFLLIKSGWITEYFSKRSLPGEWERMSDLERFNFQNDLALSFFELSRKPTIKLLENWLFPDDSESIEFPISTPILHLLGKNSDYYETLQPTVQYLKQNAAITQWFIQNGVHDLQWQYPRWLAQVVFHFISEQNIFSSAEPGGIWMVQAKE